MAENKNPEENYGSFSIEEILNWGKDEDTPESNDPKKEDVQNSRIEEKPSTDETLAPKDTGSGKKKKKGSAVKSVIWVAVIVVLSVAIATTLLAFIADISGIGKEIVHGSDHVLLEIKEGTSATEVAGMLEDNGLIISKGFFKFYLKATKKGGDMSYGVHDLTRDMGYSEILKVLADPAKAEDVKVTIKSALTVDEVAELLEEKNICKADAFIKELKEGKFESELLSAVPDDKNIHFKAEGYLFPDTYNFYENDSPHRVIQQMLDNLESKITPSMREQAQKSGRTMHEILTMASIVELESCGYYKEMPKVAAVFYNRLENWPEGQRFLQSDPTVNYESEYEEKFGKSDANEAYNTYKSEGLPPGPLCNVTEEAIEAALEPDENCKAYFFVTDKHFTFYYNETNEQHEATIQDLIKRNMWQEE